MFYVQDESRAVPGNVALVMDLCNRTGSRRTCSCAARRHTRKRHADLQRETVDITAAIAVSVQAA